MELKKTAEVLPHLGYDEDLAPSSLAYPPTSIQDFEDITMVTPISQHFEMYNNTDQEDTIVLQDSDILILQNGPKLKNLSQPARLLQHEQNVRKNFTHEIYSKSENKIRQLEKENAELKRIIQDLQNSIPTQKVKQANKTKPLGKHKYVITTVVMIILFFLAAVVAASIAQYVS